MRFTTALIIAIIVFYGCKNSNPTGSQTVEPPAPKRVALAAYGVSLDTMYNKNWSDGSWEKFGGWKTINGSSYYVLKSDGNGESYYSDSGYAGYKSTSGLIIMFDSKTSEIPDTITIGQQYNTTASFLYNGNRYTYQNTYQYNQMVEVDLSKMTFTNCLEVAITSTLIGSGVSQSSYLTSWDAIGPGTIKEYISNSYYKTMTNGYVNGKAWNIGNAVTPLASIKSLDMLSTPSPRLFRLKVRG